MYSPQKKLSLFVRYDFGRGAKVQIRFRIVVGIQIFRFESLKKIERKEEKKRLKVVAYSKDVTR